MGCPGMGTGNGGTRNRVPRDGGTENRVPRDEGTEIGLPRDGGAPRGGSGDDPTGTRGAPAPRRPPELGTAERPHFPVPRAPRPTGVPRTTEARLPASHVPPGTPGPVAMGTGLARSARPGGSRGAAEPHLVPPSEEAGGVDVGVSLVLVVRDLDVVPHAVIHHGAAAATLRHPPGTAASARA